jgi:hypothetical protein
MGDEHPLRGEPDPSENLHGSPSRDRFEEPQQRDQPILAIATGQAGGLKAHGKSLGQRGGKGAHLDRRHDQGRSRLPEAAGGESGKPPLPPAPHRPALDPEERREPVQLRGRCLALHQAHQNDHDGEIHLAPEEPQRRRGLATAAPVHRTAEAETPVVLLIHNNQPTPRFAHEGCGVHRTAAMRTAPSPGGRRKIAIEGEQKVIKPGIAQQLSVQGSLLPMEVAEMAKIGRNDPCPCGSGKKYKQCCLAKDAAAARAAAPPPVPPHRAALANLAALADLALGDDEDDELTTASNAVIDLVKAGQLDEAERAAHDLLKHFPQVHDGYDRLGMVYEARGDNRRAAECYRKVIAFVRDHPEIYEPGFDDTFQRLVDRLDPTPGSPTEGLP